MNKSKPRFFWAYSDQYAGWYSCTHKRAIFGFKPEDRHEVLRMLPDRRVEIAFYQRQWEAIFKKPLVLDRLFRGLFSFE